MSRMLASVNTLIEARQVHDLAVDIIDLKQPASGALGALDVVLVREIVAELGASALLSATIGDLPMQAAPVCEAVAAMIATGVDYIKIGFFPGGAPLTCIAELSQYAQAGHALIAVLFADAAPDFSLIPALANAGFRGVMLDTLDKRQGSLPRLMTQAQLQQFVQTAQQAGLLTGLAGSLQLDDISGLLPLHADYLGFRGGLCLQNRRTNPIDPQQVLAIRSLLHAV